MMNAKSDELDGFMDRASSTEVLTKCVLANGPADSELYRAFALLRAVGDVNLANEHDVKRLRDAVERARAEWDKLPETERRRILNGWHPASDLPTVANHLRTLARFDDNDIRWALTADMDSDGRVDFFASVELVSNIRPVHVNIQQGTTKAEALKELHAIAAAMEDYWEEAIALDGMKGLTAEAEREEEKLEIGMLVNDTGSDEIAGVVIGGFEGVNGRVYAYANARGEVDFQYGCNLQKAPGSRGGLPAVKDLQGRDPLAAFRGVSADGRHLVVDMKGRPITGEQLARRVAKPRRRARAAAA